MRSHPGRPAAPGDFDGKKANQRLAEPEWVVLTVKFLGAS
jgi:hypothetical protein